MDYACLSVLWEVKMLQMHSNSFWERNTSKMKLADCFVRVINRFVLSILECFVSLEISTSVA
jgi:hypothetical protein